MLNFTTKEQQNTEQTYMSVDNIELTPFLIAGLYKNTLIEMDTKPAIKEVLPIAKFTILGNNRSRVAIIVDETANLYLPDEQLNFLLGILSACKLSMEDVAIININKNKTVTYKSIEAELKAEKIILFGVSPAQIGLPLEFPFYQVQQYNNQTYVTADLLQHIEKDKAEKTKLWNCLKQIFIG